MLANYADAVNTEQSRLPDHVLHMRESCPVSKVRLPRMCLFKITFCFIYLHILYTVNGHE